jgi:hypothetical protein
MKPAFHVTAALPMLLLGACHTSSGLIGEANPIPIPPALEDACVTAAIGGAPGVTSVEYMRPTPNAPSVYQADRSWLYDFGAPHRALVWIRRNGGNGHFMNSYVVPGRVVESDRERFRGVMIGVNQRIEADCGLPLAERVVIKPYFASIM